MSHCEERVKLDERRTLEGDVPRIWIGAIVRLSFFCIKKKGGGGRANSLKLGRAGVTIRQNPEHLSAFSRRISRRIDPHANHTLGICCYYLRIRDRAMTGGQKVLGAPVTRSLRNSSSPFLVTTIIIRHNHPRARPRSCEGTLHLDITYNSSTGLEKKYHLSGRILPRCTNVGRPENFVAWADSPLAQTVIITVPTQRNP